MCKRESVHLLCAMVAEFREYHRWAVNLLMGKLGWRSKQWGQWFPVPS